MSLVHEMLSTTARQQPQRVALIDDGERRTFGALDFQSDRIARVLQDAGVERGDRVAIMMENCAALVVTLFGVLKAGGVFVVVNPTTKADKLAYVLNDCGARAIVANGRLNRQIGQALRDAPSVATTVWVGEVPAIAPNGVSFEAVVECAELEPSDPGLIDEDLAAIIYTSGSTGRPKGVMLTHRNLHHSTWSISNYLEIVPDDVIACVLPLSFGYGLTQVLMSARVGCSLLLERSFAYPADVMRRIAEYRVTGLPAVPTVFATILRLAPFEDLDLSSLRFLTNAAAALPPSHIRRLQELFPETKIFSMYGQTECTRVSYLDPDRLADKIASVGKAIPNMEAYVIDDEGRRVAPGVIGELVVRGASVMRGYWGDREETAQRLREGEIQGELVLHTGDLFRTDDEGFLYFVGRTDDIFDCKGEKVSPKEIEHVLYELDEVQEAAVIGVPDELEGSAIKAVVSPSGRGVLDERLIRRHCRERLESFMVPKYVEIRETLPKTESGKVTKALLR
jgi:long-chain acyl-CoA synthetase